MTTCERTASRGGSGGGHPPAEENFAGFSATVPPLRGANVPRPSRICEDGAESPSSVRRLVASNDQQSHMRKNARLYADSHVHVPSAPAAPSLALRLATEATASLLVGHLRALRASARSTPPMTSALCMAAFHFFLVMILFDQSRRAIPSPLAHRYTSLFTFGFTMNPGEETGGPRPSPRRPRARRPSRRAPQVDGRPNPRPCAPPNRSPRAIRGRTPSTYPP